MKYDAKRHLLYPVLTPSNDDYPKGEFTASVEVPPGLDPDGDVPITIKFDLNEPYISQAVQQGLARCKAMIYCTNTLYRADPEAAEGDFSISVTVPGTMLDGPVEVYPFVTSVTDIPLDSPGIHPEYQGLNYPLRANPYQPLAAAEMQQFSIIREVSTEDPLVVFEEDTDGKVPPGELDIFTEITDRQIRIVTHPETFEQISRFRQDEDQALASFYMSALVQALWVVETTPQDEAEGAAPQGWFQRLNGLRRESIQPFRMAQIIFDKPFGKLLAREQP